MREKMMCHDCGKAIKKGEKFAEYEAMGGEFVKCEACFKADSILRNYRQTEVYSRVVGYIRPVAQWNKGKQAEYKDRKEFACSC
jgi:anaerobic ribonucleoside-triphosphate reductase